MFPDVAPVTHQTRTSYIKIMLLIAAIVILCLIFVIRKFIKLLYFANGQFILIIGGLLHIR